MTSQAFRIYRTVLKKTIEAKDVVITAIKEEVKTLNHKVDDIEQYSRRNSVRVTGILKNKNEDIGKSVLEMINNRMKIVCHVCQSSQSVLRKAVINSQAKY